MNNAILCKKDADGMANSIDPDQTAPVCSMLTYQTLLSESRND